ncbi:MAG TPA: DUF4129 domain-containing protein, partial [Gaiellaceae bacterium]|nr:DUF4129 domain-containing protein [Gaiellaceae bacterium]
MPTRRSGAPASSLRVGITLGGLLAVVAVVAAGHRTSAGHGSRPSQLFFDYLLSAFLVFMVVGTVALVYLVWQERDEGLGAYNPVARRKKTITTVALLLTLMLALVLAREGGFRPSSVFHQVTVHHVVGPPGQLGNAARPLSPVGPRFRWLPAILVGGLLLALVLLAVSTRVRERVQANDARQAAEEVAAALDDSVDDLRAEPDARRAVIAAYARMERALGAVGIGREPSEAPLEYLARALEGLRASGVSVRRLTELFRLAKFSAHPLADSDKERAIEA